MIPRYQRILFWILAISSLLMALFLLRGCEQAHQRLASPVDSTPIEPPTAATAEDITLLLANDTEGSITPVQVRLSLPTEPTTRARVLLDRLLSSYAAPDSAHPLPGGPTVDDVFLLDLPLSNPSASRQKASTGDSEPPGRLAVVNLHGSFADNHPSGIETETLTVQSIVGTLHANFPDVTQVRFLVDGQPRSTLAGHADLTRGYPVIDTTFRPTTPIEPFSQP